MMNTGSVTTSKSRARRDAAGVGPRSVLAMAERAFEDDLHARTVLSLSTGVLRVLEAATLGVHAIGRGLAAAKGLNKKHATKLDRLLSNGKLDCWSVRVTTARRRARRAATPCTDVTRPRPLT